MSDYIDCDEDSEEVCFSKEELSAIKSLKRAFKKCPDTLRLYSSDGEINICKVGASSDLHENIISDGLNAGSGLTDAHDSNGNGANNSAIRT